MSDFRKNPASILIQEAASRQARSVADILSKSLPASVISINGRIVTVRIEANNSIPIPMITVPIIENEYVRAPIQPGCKGIVIGSDVSIREVSGFGTTKPNLDEKSFNLSSAVFLPISNKKWQNLEGTFLNLYGVKGVKMQESLGGGASITLSGGQVNINGTLIINGKAYLSHTHSNGHEGAPTGGVLS